MCAGFVLTGYQIAGYLVFEGSFRMCNAGMPVRAGLPTTKQLLRSTLIALAAAATILVTAVLPAEYAIDPTRVGRVLGLTQMGEIKMRLAEEAAGDAVLTEAEAPSLGLPMCQQQSRAPVRTRSA